MKTITTTVYTLDELNDHAKEHARQWYRENAIHDEWWDGVYEDAANIGLKITSFDLDRNRHAEGQFEDSAIGCAERILANHGKDCETFKTATKCLKEGAAIEDTFSDDVEERLEEHNAEFLKSILEDYSIMLQREYEYLNSDEAVDENIIANEYTFDESGKRAG